MKRGKQSKQIPQRAFDLATIASAGGQPYLHLIRSHIVQERAVLTAVGIGAHKNAFRL